jgi:hypothetical protein
LQDTLPNPSIISEPAKTAYMIYISAMAIVGRRIQARQKIFKIIKKGDQVTAFLAK